MAKTQRLTITKKSLPSSHSPIITPYWQRHGATDTFTHSWWGTKQYEHFSKLILRFLINYACYKLIDSATIFPGMVGNLTKWHGPFIKMYKKYIPESEQQYQPWPLVYNLSLLSHRLQEKNYINKTWIIRKTGILGNCMLAFSSL